MLLVAMLHGVETTTLTCAAPIPRSTCTHPSTDFTDARGCTNSNSQPPSAGACMCRLQYTTHLILFSLEIGPGGEPAALDRIPRAELLAQAREAATRHGTALLICFGGNGRSDGFSPMVRNKAHRAAFIRNLLALCAKYEFDGVDYNWEYPGYSFRGGYKAQAEVDADYQGLYALLRETRRAFTDAASRARVITMAYYPDVKQAMCENERRGGAEGDGGGEGGEEGYPAATELICGGYDGCCRRHCWRRGTLPPSST